MPNDWVDCLSDHGRAEWYTLLREMGLAYGQRKAMLEINTKLETAENEIPRLMALRPGEDKSNAD